MAETAALATAASAMAIGTLNAKERQSEMRDTPPKTTVEPQSGIAENGVRVDAGTTEIPAQHDRQVPSGEAARLTDDGPKQDLADTADAIWDPSALTARIAEQIASSVGHVLDMAAGGGGTPQTLSRDIVEQAQHIAREVHGQFAAKEPLAVLADFVPQAVNLDTLGTDIIRNVDDTLTQSGVMDLLNGAIPGPDPDEIVGDIVADLQGVKIPVDVSALVAEPLEAVGDIAGSLLGGVDQGKNPLADLFYDDGGADIAQSIVAETVGGISDLVTDIPKISFLGQPLDLGEELGGLTHGSNVLQVL